MTTVYFAHGWGFDASVWTDVIALLPHDLKTHYIDFGFRGHKQITLPKPDERIICVGHSLGVMWLLKHIPNPAGLIAINGFDCFYHHVAPDILQTMKNNLQRDVDAQMKHFLRLCGSHEKSIPAYDSHALKEGLSWLMNWNARNELLRLQCPVKVIAAKDDKIVNEEMTKTIWDNHAIEWSADGGHILPISKPLFCAKHIRGVIDDCHV